MESKRVYLIESNLEGFWETSSEARPFLIRKWTCGRLTTGVQERGRSSWYHSRAQVSAYCGLGMATRFCIAALRSLAMNRLLPTGRGTASAAQPRGEGVGCQRSCTKSRAPASERHGHVSAGTRLHGSLRLTAAACMLSRDLRSEVFATVTRQR
jgi:hypothetical protein